MILLTLPILFDYQTSLENIEINFGAAPTGIQQCSQPPQCAVQETVCGYTGKSMTAKEPTTFKVRIGPSGGPRGYESITGEIECGYLKTENICLKIEACCFVHSVKL